MLPGRGPPGELLLMRILFVSFIGTSSATGMGKWTYRLADCLRSQGHEVTLWFSEDFPLLRRSGRLSVILFPLCLAMRLAREGKQFAVAVVHEPSAFWTAATRAVGSTRVPPIVCMCHNVESRNFADLRAATGRGLAHVGFSSRIKGALARRWQSDGAIRLADHVICLSEEDRLYVEKVLGVAASRVTVMINGVTNDDLAAGRDRRHFGKRLLFVGGWIEVKGRFVLPGIWREVRESVPGASLTVVGVGVGKSALAISEIDPQGLGSVNVIEHIREDDGMRRLMTSHDVLVMPSLSEGSPLALLEAMASGLPVVASRVGGIVDIVTQEENGLLFDVGDIAGAAKLIRRVLENPNIAKRLGDGARRRAADLTWEKTAETLLRACERAIDHARLPRDSR